MDRPRNEPRSRNDASFLDAPDASHRSDDDPSDAARESPDADPRQHERRPHDQTYKALFAHDVAINL